MTYIPASLPVADQRAVDAWLVRNGCRHHVALDPVIVMGGWIEYTALCRRDAKSVRRLAVREDVAVPLGRKRVRLRYPLHEAPA